MQANEIKTGKVQNSPKDAERKRKKKKKVEGRHFGTQCRERFSRRREWQVLITGKV